MIINTDISGNVSEINIDGNIDDSAVVSGSIADNQIVDGDISSEYSLEGNITTSDVSGEVHEETSYFTEVDPTVPSWAKRPTKPDYNYQEINSKPSINAVELTGNKQLEDLNIKYLTNEQILETWNKI